MNIKSENVPPNASLRVPSRGRPKRSFKREDDPKDSIVGSEPQSEGKAQISILRSFLSINFR